MKKCPKCGSSKGVIRIVNGLPGLDLQKDQREGKILLGGWCIIDDNPDWHCKECTHEWSKAQDQLSNEGLKEYYAIVGIGESTKAPSGLLRKNEDPPWDPQRFNRDTLQWEDSQSAYNYFFGRDDDFEMITEAEAEVVIIKWKALKCFQDNWDINSSGFTLWDQITFSVSYTHLTLPTICSE